MINPVELSQALIRCKSVTPVDDGAIAVLEKVLKPLGFECTRLKYGPVENLYARYGKSGKNLCFAGHTDVVPVGDLKGWSVDPFAADIKNGVLIGRGAADMKAAIACWVTAVSRFKPENGSLSLLITGDEEEVALDGTIKVLEWMKEKGEKMDACVVGEPTNPEKLGQTIKIGRRGSITFKLTVKGTQGHVAYPHVAQNPVTDLVRILHVLKEEKLDNGNDHFQPSNLEITTVDVGNVATNVIPAKAHATFNIRFNDQHTSGGLIGWAENICKKHTKLPFTLEPQVSGESFITKPGPLSDLVSKAVEKVTGIKPELSTSGGTSDARFIKDHCPVLEFGLMNKTAHKVDEQARVEDIEKLADVYEEIIHQFFARAS